MRFAACDTGTDSGLTGGLWLCDTGTDSGLTARTNGGVVKSSLCQLLSTPERAGGAAKGGLILSTV